MQLYNLQKNFANYIYGQDKLSIIKEVDSANNIAADKRVDIYKNNFFGNLLNSLEITYNITKKITGDDCFYYLANKYIKENKSQSGNLEDYGDNFYNFIEEEKKDHKLLYLSDIAKLEWFFNLAYFAAEVKDIDIESLQSLSEQEFMNLTFDIHPSCYLIHSPYPVYNIWLENKNDILSEININKNSSQSILIERSNKAVNVWSLEKNDFIFLTMIKEGKNIYDIYEEISIKNLDFDIGSLINKYISSKIIINFKK